MNAKVCSIILSVAILSTCFTGITYAATGPTVELWVSQVNAGDTGMAKALEKQVDTSFDTDTGSLGNYTICVDENNTYQQMDGFGASMTEASAYLVQTKLTQTARAELMNKLFDKDDGIGLSMLRQTIGASDHCVAPYNFDPLPDTDSLPNFDFSPELTYIFPALQQALAVDPGRIKIICSSWTPPGWMKENNSDLGTANGIRGSLKADKYQAYANYLLKFVQNYESRGVPIYAITPTNEPDFASNIWPALPMYSSEQINLISNYLNPTFKNNNMNTKIICWDHSYTTTNYANGKFAYDVLGSSSAYATTDGSAWHWYEGNEEVMSLVHKEFPAKDVWFTEGSGGEWEFPKWRTAFLNQTQCVINIARNWSKSIIFWNIALDENGGPDYYYDVYRGSDSTNRGLVTIDKDTGDISYNVDYYTLGHVSKFVEPGAYRIDSTSLQNDVETVAFKNPDGSKVLVMSNRTAAQKDVKVRWGSQAFTYQLPAEAAVTFKWTGTQDGRTIQPVWFNNFEQGNGFNAGTNTTVSISGGGANLNSNSSVSFTTSTSGDPGTSSQCVTVTPSSGSYINSNGFEYLVFSVKDTVNTSGSTIRVTFVDNDNNTWSGWTDEKSVYNNWTRIWMPIGKATGIDRSRIKEIRIGEYWPGIYYVDDLSFSLGYKDDIPSFTDNLVVNSSLENDGCATSKIAGWNYSGAVPASDYLEKNSNAKSGRFHHAQYSVSAYDAYTYQVISELENGTYTLKAWVQSSGGQNSAKMLATDFGSSEVSVNLPTTSTWTQMSIDNIEVTNGQCTIGFYSDGNANNRACFDDVEFYRTYPYQNPNLTVEERVNDLLARMTLEEKIGQMLQVERLTGTPSEVASNGIGSVLSGGGSIPSTNTPTVWADMIDSYQSAAMSTRLRIPILYGVDAVHGHNNVYGATIFPHNIGLGATRDAELAERIGAATAEEVRATGVNWAFSPCIAAPQDDRWGRTYEGFSESPALVAELGAAMTKGLQGLKTDSGFLKGTKVIASLKHWVADGNTTDGDDQGNAVMTSQDLELFIKPYSDAIAAGARSVMVDLGTINNVRSHANYNLITEVLKGQLGFTGIVISDWNGADALNTSDYSYSLKTAINAGIDMFMEPTNWKTKGFFSTVINLVNTNQVAQSRIDDAVTRILRVKFESGVFESPYADRSLLSNGSFGGAAHREIAREAVRKSATLLKNDNSILPLSKDSRVFVAGAKADDMGYQCGGWTISWQGSSGDITTGTTILDGIRDAVTNSSNVTYSADGSGAAGNDVAIVVVGESPYAEWFGDAGTDQPIANLDLGIEDQSVVDTVKSSGVPTIVIMLSGRPMNITSRLGDWKGFIAAWLPGTEGEGLADVIFGDYDFSGKLPVSWPASFDSTGIKVNAGDSSYHPLFPFGYGLNTASGNTKELPGVIEAENFNAANGVASEASSDTNGGLDVGWIDSGDWMDYRVNIPSTGTYSVRLRVASPGGASNAIQLSNSSTTPVAFTVPSTGGWQSWTTVAQDVSLTAGVQTLRLSAVTDGWNLNSIEFVPVTASSSGNLLTNGDVESADLTGWTTWNAGTNAVNADTDNVYNGSYKMTIWAGSDYQQLVSQTQTMENGTYRFSAWVRSSGGQCSLHLYAKNYGGVERIAEIESNASGSWTRYSIDNIKVTTGQIDVGVWADAFANNWTALDNFELVKTNELSNPGFECGNLSAWTGVDSGTTAQKADIDAPFAGSYKLTHWAAASYQQQTSQLVNVPDGTYKFSVWVRSGGGQNELQLFAGNCGGFEVNTEIGSTQVSDWTEYTISGINVTNGQIEVGVRSDANAGNWAAFDNFELIRQ